MLNNMILCHDGLDTLWEADVNWKHVNPEYENEEYEDNDNNHATRYLPTLHNEDYFFPLLVGDLLQQNERRDYGNEKIKFKKLRDMLANHLHLITYVAGELRWPKVRNQQIKYIVWNITTFFLA
jgi:disulfide oxidoreductase YuzD